MQLDYFFNFSGRIFPDYSVNSFDTMIVTDGYVLRTGFNMPIPAGNVTKHDLGGAIVMPPFVDSHTHFLQTGIVLSGIQLNKARSLNDIFDSILLESKKNKIIIGWNLDIQSLKEKRFPTQAELDKVSSNNFIWLVSTDLHMAVANSEALKWAMQKYPKLEHIKGLVSGSSYNAISYKINGLLTDNYKFKCLQKAEEICIKKGVGTVHALEGTENDFSETLLVDRFFQNSNIEGIIYNQSSIPDLPLKKEWKQMGGCILVDGSLSSHTAALSENYNDLKTSGNLFLNSEKIMEITKTAYTNKLQLALHAIGDMACEIVSASYFWAYDNFGESLLGNRIEHFMMPNNRAIRNARKSKTIIGIQPAFDYFWGGKNGMYSERLGIKRAMACNPFKTLSDSGISLIGGSDSPVTPIDPILGIHSIVNHKNPDEQLSLNQAFNIFINEPHRTVGNFEKRGHLKTGKRADFICLDTDPFAIAKQRIKDIKVISMYLSGKKVNEA